METSYYSNGQKSCERLFTDAGVHLTTKTWYENGTQSSLVNYETGERQSWYLSGQLAAVYTLKNDKLEGLYEEWHLDGRKKKTWFYKNGIRVAKPKHL